MRYEVRSCPNPPDGNAEHGHLLKEFQQYPAAKRYAEKHAHNHHFGTVIIDTKLDIADWGSEWSLANDAEILAEAPDYSRRD